MIQARHVYTVCNTFLHLDGVVRRRRACVLWLWLFNVTCEARSACLEDAHFLPFRKTGLRLQGVVSWSGNRSVEKVRIALCVEYEVCMYFVAHPSHLSRSSLVPFRTLDSRHWNFVSPRSQELSQSCHRQGGSLAPIQPRIAPPTAASSMISFELPEYHPMVPRLFMTIADRLHLLYSDELPAFPSASVRRAPHLADVCVNGKICRGRYKEEHPDRASHAGFSILFSLPSNIHQSQLSLTSHCKPVLGRWFFPTCCDKHCI